MRLLERLQEYDLEIEYLPGAQNFIQDVLSRRPDYKDPPLRTSTLPQSSGTEAEVDCTNVDIDLFTLVTVNADDWLQEVRAGYKQDLYFAQVLLPVDERDGSANDLRRRKSRRQHYTLSSDGLITHTKSGALCIPDAMRLRQKLPAEAHDTPVGGHFGVQRTASALARQFFWPRLCQDVKQYVPGCASCHRAKASNQKPYGLVLSLDIPSERWKRINIDFIVKLPLSSSGNDTIITFIDELTKRAHWITTSEKPLTAEHFTKIFVDFSFRLHGLPTDIVSDRHVLFTSEWWRHLTKIWQSKLKMSTAFHPQTDGQAEMANSIVERYLWSFFQTLPLEWDRLLSLAEFSYNAHSHQSTGLAPFEEDLGYIPHLPMDVIAESRPSRPDHSFATSFAATMADILHQLQKSLKATQSRQIKEANKKSQPHNFQTCDKDLINTKNLPITYGNAGPEQGSQEASGYQLHKVLQEKYVGEFTLGEQRGPNAFEIADLPSNSRIAQTFNVDQLRHSNIDHSRPQAPPPPICLVPLSGATPRVEYEVENILDWRQDQKGSIQFQVKWVGLNKPEDITWEKQQAFTGAKEALSDFICRPENAELAHLLRWPQTTRVAQAKVPNHRSKLRIKGKPPSRRSSRIQARASPP